MRTSGSENRESAKASDKTPPGKTNKVSGIERVGGSTKGTHSFPIVNHPEVCDVSHGPHGKMDR
jgi:hypothetical protein